MDKRIILAVAGAGKTYYICKQLDITKRNLILTYTKESVENIKEELRHIHGNIPSSTTISTFHSFVFRHLILPYELSIAHQFNQPSFTSKGITTFEPPSKLLAECKNKENYTTSFDEQELILTPDLDPNDSNITSKSKKIVKNNPCYKRKGVFEHYITKQNKYYSSTISELALFVKKDKNLNTDKLIVRAINRLKIFFDEIFVDEFQDFRENDYKLLMEVADRFPKICLVGDFYQHSVLADNNSGPPFDKVDYEKFICNLSDKGFHVDTTTLLKTRRCAPDICSFVREKLKIQIFPAQNKPGKIIWVDSSNINEILDRDDIIKLVYNNASKCSFRAMNWSYSKGNTVNAACIILTNDLEKIDSYDFVFPPKKEVTKNRLYVALTRSSGDLYLIKPSLLSNKDQQSLFEDL